MNYLGDEFSLSLRSIRQQAILDKWAFICRCSTKRHIYIQSTIDVPQVPPMLTLWEESGREWRDARGNPRSLREHFSNLREVQATSWWERRPVEDLEDSFPVGDQEDRAGQDRRARVGLQGGFQFDNRWELSLWTKWKSSDAAGSYRWLQLGVCCRALHGDACLKGGRLGHRQQAQRAQHHQGAGGVYQTGWRWQRDYSCFVDVSLMFVYFRGKSCCYNSFGWVEF